jgi:hypothetical protein
VAALFAPTLSYTMSLATQAPSSSMR